MPIAQKYMDPTKHLKRDIRPLSMRVRDWLINPDNAVILIGMIAASIAFVPGIRGFSDLLLIGMVFYVLFLARRKEKLSIRLPAYAKVPDPNGPGGKPEGILFIGNDTDDKSEVWLSNNDARTHILVLGTTGSGKTEALKSLSANALTWGSGFIYIDGKADTDLWASIFALARRFGRDDDLLILNYMTGNSDAGSASNSLNPFSSGSASYLTNLMVSLMPASEGDNAMWQQRAVALLSSVMPALTWKRDNQGLLLDVDVIRKHLSLAEVIRLSRDPKLPHRITNSLKSYLDTLPGYDDNAYGDDGSPRPPEPDQPPYDTTVPSQQHGYLSMQFTRALGSLADDYGYVFGAQLADVDMMDVVLNRRILVALLPALEKSPEEAANLGKITAATLKGMMGSTLGAKVEGEWADAIDNKVTRAPSPFMTIFDEVGYYTTEGMGVMAAQARSLGFSLVFAAQDLPALEKRVKQEARSITGNCNLKIFGKLEDPTDTKEFFEKTVGQGLVAEAGSFQMNPQSMGNSYFDSNNASIQLRPKAQYSELKQMKPGGVVLNWENKVFAAQMFYANPDKVKAIRVQRFLPVSSENIHVVPQDKAVDIVLQRLRDRNFEAMRVLSPAPIPAELMSLAEGFALAQKAGRDLNECAALAVARVAEALADSGDDERAQLVQAASVSTSAPIPSGFPPLPPRGAPEVQAPDRPLSWADVAGLSGGAPVAAEAPGRWAPAPPAETAPTGAGREKALEEAANALLALCDAE